MTWTREKMENLSKEDKVARRLKGDSVEIVEEREAEVSVTVKGRQVVEPERRRSYPKRFPGGEGKLAAVYVVYFPSRSQSKLIAVPAGVYYYRPESLFRLVPERGGASSNFRGGEKLG